MKRRLKRVISAWMVGVLILLMLTSVVYAKEAVETNNIVQNQVDMKEMSVLEKRLNYIYIEKPYMDEIGNQKIVISWGDGTEKYENVSITVLKDDGTKSNWMCNKESENIFLFEKEFVDKSERGVYQIESIHFTEKNEMHSYSLVEENAKFGINKLYDGIEQLRPINGNQESPVTASVVSLDGTEMSMAQTRIADALECVDDIYENKRDTEKVEEIVVALDPGHDNKHGGGRVPFNGKTEQELVLKIAQYCKQELEKYEGVKVYMTRTSADCPHPTAKNSGRCIEQRVLAAKKAGAKIFVSLHLNSSPSSSAKGAEIIIPNSSWQPQLNVDGKALAEQIIKELSSVGLSKRPTPIYSKDTTINEKYPDGSKSDYFSVQIYSKESGIPGIIVEHAFMTNSSDYHTFLSTETGLEKLGDADAKGIAEYLGLHLSNQNDGVQGDMDGNVIGDIKWELDENGNQYCYLNGEKIKGFFTIDGERYYFDNATGSMWRGWLVDGNKIYYFGSDGKMVFGHQKIEGSNYYFDQTTGTNWNGWVVEDDKIYYFGSDGRMLFGHQKIEGSNYYFDQSTGTVWKGWVIEGSKIYYFSSDGKMVTGFAEIDGSSYYFNKDTGEVLKGWLTDDNNRKYYFGSDGKMIRGHQVIEGSNYYFDTANGSMWNGWLVDNGKIYYYNSDGKMKKGHCLIEGSNYYFDQSTGTVWKGWVIEGNKIYYFGSDGKMVTGFVNLEGSRYYFDQETGEVLKGWLTDDNNRKYYFGSDGKMVFGHHIIGNSRYYFDQADGSMWKGWMIEGDKIYYYGSDGKMKKGHCSIEGSNYYFDQSTGTVWKGWVIEGSNVYYFGSNGKMLYGRQTIEGATYYFDKTTGISRKGWIEEKNNKYYCDLNGKMVFGYKKINNFDYYFDQSAGTMWRGWMIVGKDIFYFQPDGKMAKGYCRVDGTEYYFDLITGKNIKDTDAIYTKISGKSMVSVDKLIQFYKRGNNPYPSEPLGKGGAPTIEKFCEIFLEEATMENIRVEVAFVQAMKETGYLKFGNDVKIEQFNFAGLGATGGGTQGADFSGYGEEGVRMGIRAQIQHLKCYANFEPLNNPCVDPRWGNWLRGKAKYVEWLGIKENPFGTGWAAAPKYGYNLKQMLDIIVK